MQGGVSRIIAFVFNPFIVGTGDERCAQEVLQLCVSKTAKLPGHTLPLYIRSLWRLADARGSLPEQRFEVSK